MPLLDSGLGSARPRGEVARETASVRQTKQCLTTDSSFPWITCAAAYGYILSNILTNETCLTVRLMPGLAQPLIPTEHRQHKLIFECARNVSFHRCCGCQTRNIAPILFPSIALAERIVSISSTIAHTPRALAR